MHGFTNYQIIHEICLFLVSLLLVHSYSLFLWTKVGIAMLHWIVCCLSFIFFVLSESSFELEFDQVEHVIQTISQLPPYSSSFQCDKTTDKLFGGGRETSH